LVFIAAKQNKAETELVTTDDGQTLSLISSSEKRISRRIIFKYGVFQKMSL
jgi:hypothetical protein